MDESVPEGTPPADGAAADAPPDPDPSPEKPGAAVPATVMGQLAWHHLVHGGWDDIAERYLFDTRPLTNKRPYFAAYVKPGDLARVTDRLELLQDEWGYLLLWATLAIACMAALSLVLIPLIFGWRTIFSHNPGKFRTIIYFACLGAGYIMVEVGLISDFMLALSNATLSASVLITGEVARTTGYEPGFPPQQAWLDGRWQPDPLVLDEQALIVNVRDRGLVVITGCGHAGVVNIARYARRLTGDQPLYALLGGFHLGGPLFEPLIPRVLDDLAALDPGVLVPAHCTGWRAQHAISARFPEAYVPNAVGTSLLL